MQFMSQGGPNCERGRGGGGGDGDGLTASFVSLRLARHTVAFLLVLACLLACLLLLAVLGRNIARFYLHALCPILPG